MFFFFSLSVNYLYLFNEGVIFKNFWSHHSFKLDCHQKLVAPEWIWTSDKLSTLTVIKDHPNPAWVQNQKQLDGSYTGLLTF